MKLYQYKKCSTCRKAIQYLDKKNIAYKDIDITEQPPTKTELKQMLGFYEGNIKKLFNTSGVQYREMKVSEKLKSMSNAEAIELLSKNGKLVKRPFLIDKDKNKGIVGFKEDEWKKNL